MLPKKVKFKFKKEDNYFWGDQNAIFTPNIKTSVSEELFITIPKTARYYLHGIPSSKTKEVWFVVHGYGQLAAYFIRNFEQFDPETTLVIAPEGLSRFYLEGTTPNSRIGATWMTKEDRENEIKDYVQYFDLLLADILQKVSTDVSVNVFGFSQGCSTLCRWVAYGNVKPARMVLWAGTFPPDVDLKVFASKFQGFEVDVVYGKNDEYLSWINADEITQWMTSAGIDFRVTTFDGKHEILKDVLNNLLEKR